MDPVMTADGPKQPQDQLKRARMRSLAIAWALGILVIIFYAATMVRLGPNALQRDDFAKEPNSTAVPMPAEPDTAACQKAGTC